MKKIIEKSSFLRSLTAFWTVVVFVAIGWDFLKDNTFREFVFPLVVIYVALLAIYAGDKEFERWCSSHRSTHPGEVFVGLWTVLVFGIMILDFIMKKPYEISGEVVSAYIAVLSILAITRRSKSLYAKHRRRK